MLLKDVFADIQDLEATLRSKGAEKAIPYFSALYGEEEALVQRASGESWVGVSVFDGTYDITEPASYERTLEVCRELMRRNKRTYCFMALDSAQVWLGKGH